MFMLVRKERPLDKRLGWQQSRSGRCGEMKIGWFRSFGMWCCVGWVAADVSGEVRRSQSRVGHPDPWRCRNFVPPKIVTHPTTTATSHEDLTHQPHRCENHKSCNRKFLTADGNEVPFPGLRDSSLITTPTELPSSHTLSQKWTNLVPYQKWLESCLLKNQCGGKKLIIFLALASEN